MSISTIAQSLQREIKECAHDLSAFDDLNIATLSQEEVSSITSHLARSSAAMNASLDFFTLLREYLDTLENAVTQAESLLVDVELGGKDGRLKQKQMSVFMAAALVRDNYSN